VDSSGRPKAAYWYLKRALAPVALLAADEGLNGLWLHALNDTCEPIDGEIRIATYSGGRARCASAPMAVTVPARGSRSVHADALFDGFRDLTYAYRFGPPGHEVVAAALRDRASGAILAVAHSFPSGLRATCDHDIGLVAGAEPLADGGSAVVLETNRFAYAVTLDVPGFTPDDNYLHVEPGEPRRVVLRTKTPGRPLRGTASALNGSAPVSIVVIDRARGVRC
jgi:beta-mannosidase